jgi:hypothetical protein
VRPRRLERAITSTLAWAALAGACAGEPPTLPSPGIELGSSGAVGDGDTPGSTSEGDGGETTGHEPSDTTPPDGSSSGSEDAGGHTVCGHTCSADEDCLGVFGLDFGYVCHEAGCVHLCSNDDECAAWLSGWTQYPCASTIECPRDRICVDIGDGTGGCAWRESCETAGLVPVTAIEIPSGADVLVCGREGGTCDDGTCRPSCIDDRDCNGLSCDAATGTCVCSSDAQCVAMLTGVDTCVDGRCAETCSGAGECTASTFRGGSVTCE